MKRTHTFRIMNVFIRDDRAVETLPMRLVAYVTITAVIVGLAAHGFYNVMPAMSEASLERQLSPIAASIQLMTHESARNLNQLLGPDGSMRTFHLSTPGNTEYISFGVDPDPDGDGSLGNTPRSLMTDSDDHVIFYKVHGGGPKRIILDGGVRFREGAEQSGVWMVNTPSQGAVLAGASEMDLTFEYVYDPDADEDERYLVLVRHTDGHTSRLLPYECSIEIQDISLSSSYQNITLMHISGENVNVSDIKIRTYVNGEALQYQLDELPTYGSKGYNWVGGVLHQWTADHTWEDGEIGRYSIARSNAVLSQGDVVKVEIVYRSTSTVVSSSQRVV